MAIRSNLFRNLTRKFVAHQYSSKEWLDQGYAFRKAGQDEEALNAFEQAISLNSYNIHARYNRGLILADLKRYDEAIEEYNRAIKLDPNFVLVYKYKDKAYSDLQRYVEALEAYDRALLSRRNDATLHNFTRGQHFHAAPLERETPIPPSPV